MEGQELETRGFIQEPQRRSVIRRVISRANNRYVIGFGVTLVILLIAALVGIWLTFGYGVDRGNNIEDEVDDIWHFIKKDLTPTLKAILLALDQLDNKVDALTDDVEALDTKVEQLQTDVTSLQEDVTILQENVTTLSNDLDDLSEEINGVIPPVRVLCGQSSDLNFADFDPDTPVNVGMELVSELRFPTSALPGAQVLYNADEGEFEVNNLLDSTAVPLHIQARVLIKDAGGEDGMTDNTYRFMVTTNGTDCLAAGCPSSFYEDRQRYLSELQQFGTNTIQLELDVTVNVRNGDKFYFFVSSKGALGSIDSSEDENTSVCAGSFFSFQPQTRLFFQDPIA